MTTNRREFFKTAAVGAVGAAGMLGGVTAAEAKSSKSAKYDLVIVGAGCGGLVMLQRKCQMNRWIC